MKLALIGFGNAGGKVADELLRFQQETDRQLYRSVLAVNTARSDLARLATVPDDDQVLIGQTDQRVKGHGVGSDPDLGAQVTRNDRTELERALDGVPIHEIDGFLVVAGLGGGTGSGGAPVLAERLQELYGEPVYGLAILPSEDEGGRASYNAARSLQTFVDATDNLLLFDNDAWQGAGETVESGYRRMNREIAKRIGTLLSVGDLDGSAVSENVMDASDVRRTLDTGGISVIAYAEADLEPETRKSRGLLGRFRNDAGGDVDTAKKVNGLVRQAIQARLTCPADVSSVERSLVVVSGPPAEFSQKGLESARRWVEERTGSIEVLAGDDPRESADHLSAVVLLSTVTEVPRVDALQEQAVDAAANVEAMSEDRDEKVQDLITTEDERLDPI